MLLDEVAALLAAERGWDATALLEGSTEHVWGRSEDGPRGSTADATRVELTFRDDTRATLPTGSELLLAMERVTTVLLARQ